MFSILNPVFFPSRCSVSILYLAIKQANEKPTEIYVFDRVRHWKLVYKGGDY